MSDKPIDLVNTALARGMEVIGNKPVASAVYLAEKCAQAEAALAAALSRAEQAERERDEARRETEHRHPDWARVIRERDEARAALTKAKKRGDVLWRVLADAQGPDGKIRGYEEALDSFDRELEAFCSEMVSSEPERVKRAREDERSGWAEEVAGRRANEARLGAALDSSTVENERLRTALKALLNDYQELHDNDTKRELFEDPAIAALSAPTAPGVEVLRCAREWGEARAALSVVCQEPRTYQKAYERESTARKDLLAAVAREKESLK